LRELVEEFGPLIYTVARRIVADPALAEEVAQDTFVLVWRRPEAFDPARGSLQAWLLGVAHNKAIDLVRREQSRRRTVEALLAEAESGEVAEDERLEGIEARQGLQTALRLLPPPQREAVVLAYFGGRTYREVAVELGIPEGTAKTRLRDGLARLRHLMTTPGGSEP
jgi:RNA polymerase sigma factor (sigma-70 family)